jgi:hypothetical protein
MSTFRSCPVFVKPLSQSKVLSVRYSVLFVAAILGFGFGYGYVKVLVPLGAPQIELSPARR